MVLLAAGRRGAAAAGPPCGGSLRPGPRSVPRLPRARPLRGSAPGRTRWGAWAAPAVGGGPLPPARAPGGAARGPLLGACGGLCRPPVGPAPHRGRGPPFPPRRPLGRSSGAVLRRPRLRRVGAPACSAPGLSAAWSFFPWRFRPQPSPLRSPRPFPLPSPSPSGGGGAQEVDARCGGDGRRPPTPAHKKSLPACGSRHPRKGTKDVFCSIFHLPAKPPSLTGLLKISRPGRVRSDGGTRRNARRISGPDIKTAAFGKASPKSMEMG